MKRPNYRNRYCPKCGGKIGMIRREEFSNLYGCVDGGHVQVDGTYGYSPEDFPKKVKPPSKKEIDKFIGGIRYPKFAAFAVNKLIAKFKLSREQAVAAWKARAV